MLSTCGFRRKTPVLDESYPARRMGVDWKRFQAESTEETGLSQKEIFTASAPFCPVWPIRLKLSKFFRVSFCIHCFSESLFLGLTERRQNQDSKRDSTEVRPKIRAVSGGVKVRMRFSSKYLFIFLAGALAIAPAEAALAAQSSASSASPTRVVGSVTAISGQSVTVKPDSGAPVTFTVGDSARIL